MELCMRFRTRGVHCGPRTSSVSKIGLTTGSRWSWEDVKRFWSETEAMGFDSIWMSDHIMTEGYTTRIRPSGTHVTGRPASVDPDA